MTGENLHASYRTLLHRVRLGHTEFRPRPHLPPGIANGYLKHDAKQVNSTRINFSPWWSAGAMVSTVGDLAKRAHAIASGHHLLNPRLQRARLHVTEPPFYGLGIFADAAGPALFHAFDSLACIALHPRVSPGARCALGSSG